MRNIVVSLAAAVALTACDPVIRKFEVTPTQLPCGGDVTVNWEITGPGGELSTSKPVNPPLPGNPPLTGSQVVSVTETTEFSFVVPGAGHKHQTVNVSGKLNPKQLAFTGVCTSTISGPTYNAIAVSAAEAPGTLTSITTDADWPIHVFIDGQEIALGAGGGPIAALPQVAAAGSYTITIPGIVGANVCKEIGGGDPVGGNDAAAPLVSVFITGSCK
jgi:hypothetical protein